MSSRNTPPRKLFTRWRPFSDPRNVASRRLTRLRHEPLEHRLMLDAGGPAGSSVGDEALAAEVGSAQDAYVQAAPELQEDSAAFAKFTSAEHIKQYLIDDALERYSDLFGKPGDHGWYRFRMPEIDGGVFLAATAADAGSAADFSETNTQVEGVDEGDIVETDGNYLYVLGETDVTMIDVRDAQSMQVACRVDVPGQPFAEYLIGDRLTVLSRDWTQPGWIDPVLIDPAWDLPIVPLSAEGLPVASVPTLTVTVLDVSDPSAPTLLDQTELDGTYVDSRAIGESVYVVSSHDFVLPQPLIIPSAGPEVELDPGGEPDALHAPHFRDEGYVYETQEQYLERIGDHVLDLALPGFVSLGADGQVTKSGFLTEPTDIYQPGASEDTNLVSVTVLDVGDGDPGPASSVAVPAHNSAKTYVSPESLYVFNHTRGWWNESEETSILKFDLGRETGSVELSATGVVPGSILNQFSVDEHDGFLRVATTSGWSGRWGIRGERSNNLLVLQQDGQTLETVGQLEGLAPGEQIYSVRFMAERAFMVTFRKVDPLFAIDLSDPTDPQVKGELKIPGFSNYLHAVDENHLIGIGRHADEETGLFADPQVSLFDVADLANPELVDRYTLDTGRTGGMNAVADHHAVAYYPDRRILTVSLAAPDPDNSYRGTDNLWVFRIDTIAGADTAPQPSGVELLGRIEHDRSVGRSVRIGDQLNAISEDRVTVHNIFEPETQLGELDFPMTVLRKVEYREVDEVELAEGERWYHLTAARQGILTVQATFSESAEADLQLTLYDGFQNQLATSDDLSLPEGDSLPLLRPPTDEGRERIDWQTEAGDGFYLRVSGTAEDVALAIGNLLEYVVVEETQMLRVHGTNGDDTVQMRAYVASDPVSGGDFGAHEVVINGLEYDFDASLVVPGGNTIQFYGGRGQDSISLDLTSWAEIDNVEAVLRPNSATITRTDDNDGTELNRLEVEDFSSIEVIGADLAKLFDSEAVDEFVATPDRAELTGPDYSNRVEDVDYVHAYSSAGDDVAKLYDSPDQDRFVGTDQFGKLYGEGFFNRAKRFRYVHGYSTAGGDDSAKLIDSAGDDTFEATPTFGRLFNGDFYRRAKFFRYVHAYARSGGDDVAEFHDSPGDDTFVVTPKYSKMHGEGFLARAKFFDTVHNRSGRGGVDRVRARDAVFRDESEMEDVINHELPPECVVWLYDVEEIEGRPEHGSDEMADRVLAAYWPE